MHKPGDTAIYRLSRLFAKDTLEKTQEERPELLKDGNKKEEATSSYMVIIHAASHLAASKAHHQRAKQKPFNSTFHCKTDIKAKCD